MIIINNRLKSKIVKSVFFIITAFCVVIGVIYFGKCYIQDGAKPNFSLNQNIGLLTLSILIIFIAVILVFLSISHVLLSKKLEELSRSFLEYKDAFLDFTEQVDDIEDNLARCSRTTQELILGLYSKFGVGSDEKKS